MTTGTSTPVRGRIRQYDHSAFYPTLRATDCFLCTYPKSGTTWLGFLIAQAIKSRDGEQLDINAVNKYVPDVNLLYTRSGSLAQYSGLADPRFFRCHAPYNPNLPRVIYILRDPRDVLLSYWHYKRFLSKDFTVSLSEYLRSGDHWPCRWDQHVESWLLPRLHPNMLVFRYEQLHAQTAQVLRSALSFAGVECPDERIDRAVEAARFDRMRAAEEEFGVHGSSGDENERFMRKGRCESWREEMGPDDLRFLEEQYGPIMRQVGYETVTCGTAAVRP